MVGNCGFTKFVEPIPLKADSISIELLLKTVLFILLGGAEPPDGIAGE